MIDHGCDGALLLRPTVLLIDDEELCAVMMRDILSQYRHNERSTCRPTSAPLKLVSGQANARRALLKNWLSARMASMENRYVEQANSVPQRHNELRWNYVESWKAQAL